MHSKSYAFILYRLPVLACNVVVSDARLRPLHLKFDNRIKIDFFVSIIEYQKKFEFNIPSVKDDSCLNLTLFSQFC